MLFLTLDYLANEGYILIIYLKNIDFHEPEGNTKMYETELKNNPHVETFVSTPESRNALEISKVLSPDIESFCAQEGILEHLATALELVRKNFPLVQGPTLKLMVDMETKTKWVVVEFTTRGEVTEVFENHRSYTRSWIASVPWPKGRKIRLEYDIKNGL